LANDTYVVDNMTYFDSHGNQIVESFRGGIDTIVTKLSYTLTAELENLTLTGTSDAFGTGNAQDNVITGNDGNNSLYGDLGNDTLIGGGGTNYLAGGKGNDIYMVTNVNDTLVEKAGEGDDTVVVGQSYTLNSNFENLTLNGTSAINGQGNGLNNILTGNVANNTLNGGDGADTLYGAAGNDVLVGGAGADMLAGGVGNDTLDGGAGKDVYIFKPQDNSANGGIGLDTILNFASNRNSIFDAGEDTLDLTGMFGSQSITASNINQYLHMNGTTLQVDRDGAGSAYSFVSLANIQGTNITTANLDELFTAGQIIV